MAPVRVLIADDSPIFVEALSLTVQSDSGFTVAGTADDGAQAVQMAAELGPDLIIMDVQMPHLDGLRAVEAIMASRPTPILVMTADPRSSDAGWCFDALASGALDLRPKPSAFPLPEVERSELLSHLALLAHTPVVYRPPARRARAHSASPTHPTAPPDHLAGPPGPTPVVVGVVASTGGPAVLAALLAALPSSLPTGLVVVQHLAPGFAPRMAAWLDQQSALTVAVATEGAPLAAGTALIAPDGSHTRVNRGGLIELDHGPAVGGHRPAGDVLLDSLAEAHGPRAAGVVLTGMGSDGAAGLLALRRAGGRTLAQDEQSSVVFGMPRAALDNGGAERAVGRAELGPTIAALCAGLPIAGAGRPQPGGVVR